MAQKKSVSEHVELVFLSISALFADHVCVVSVLFAAPPGPCMHYTTILYCSNSGDVKVYGHDTGRIQVYPETGEIKHMHTQLIPGSLLPSP